MAGTVKAPTAASIATKTDEFFALRKKELAAAKTLAGRMAAVGRKLIEIKDALDRGPDKTAWMEWLKSQAARARREDLPAMSDRTARNYMALARFAQDFGNRLPIFLHLEPACLYPLLTLGEDDLAELANRGVPTNSGDRVPLATASKRQIEWAAKSIRDGRRPPAPSGGKIAPSRVTWEAVLAYLAATPITVEQAAELADAMTIVEDGAGDDGQPDAPPNPVARWAMLPGVILAAGRAIVPPGLTRTAAALNVITAMGHVMRMSDLVRPARGKLQKGVKTEAKTTWQKVWKGVVGWPAYD